MARSRSRSDGPIQAVFGTTELLEAVLLQLETRTLLRSQRVSRSFKATVDWSIKLQQKLFFRPMPAGAKYHCTECNCISLACRQNTGSPLPDPLLTRTRIHALVTGPLNHRFSITPAGIMTIHSGSASRQRDQELRHGSWRKMLIQQPLERKVKYERWHHGKRKEYRVCKKQGVRTVEELLNVCWPVAKPKEPQPNPERKVRNERHS